VLHGALGLGAMNAVLALVAYRLLKSGWRLKG
jgi:ABC-2 type transport system permease protein